MQSMDSAVPLQRLLDRQLGKTVNIGRIDGGFLVEGFSLDA